MWPGRATRGSRGCRRCLSCNPDNSQYTRRHAAWRAAQGDEGLDAVGLVHTCAYTQTHPRAILWNQSIHADARIFPSDVLEGVRLPHMYVSMQWSV